MGMAMMEKKSLTREVTRRYKKASKKEKGVILDEFTASTGYNRSYASHILSNWGKRLIIRLRGEVVAVVIGEQKAKIKRKKPKVYGKEVDDVLRELWAISDYLCGKRLAYFIRESLPSLEQFGEITVNDETREKLMKISPARIDRRLSLDKMLIEVKGKSRTKPGILLKHQIPVRTFSGWDDDRPGFVEVDLVSHEGGNGRGDFIQSLNVTDISTCWTEIRAVKNKAQVWVFEALMKIKELQMLNVLYSHLRLYINFFIPVAKKTGKIRIGSKVKKMYDKPMTPYRRVMESKYIDSAVKEKLAERYSTLNPAQLKREICSLQNKLLKLVIKGNKFYRKQQTKGEQYHRIFT
ncbi:hypothetical protein KKB18_04990 [bacterium]|nr:hypothetical protein [bacterium]